MQSYSFKVAKDFCATPGPRYIKEGEHSGELFRIEYLLPIIKVAIKENKKLIIDLDGTAGYGTSFLEEAFGGLIRIDNIDYSVLKKTLEFKSDEEPFLIEDIQYYIEDADKKKK